MAAYFETAEGRLDDVTPSGAESGRRAIRIAGGSLSGEPDSRILHARIGALREDDLLLRTARPVD
jgi:hypothetical protein